MPLPIILDCDPGHDDAIALLLALASPDLALLGVTTTYGNQTLEKTTSNTLRVLELSVARTSPSRRAPIVRSGASSSSRRTCTARAVSTGRSCPTRRSPPSSDDAVAFAREQIRSAAEPVTIVATGPLTNVARHLAAHGTDRVARIVLMGGAIAEGNFTPAAEFNVCDPDHGPRLRAVGALAARSRGIRAASPRATTPFPPTSTARSHGRR